MPHTHIEISEIKSKKDFRHFLKLPFSLYAKDPFYVPPLTREMKKHFSQKNPFFKHASVRCFIARKNGRPSGRIVSIINKRHIELHDEKAGFFGFFESPADHEVASALLDRVASALKQEGMSILRGPMNFSTNEECGFLIEGHNCSPMLMTPYNPPYYNNLMESCGMTKAKDLYAYIVDIPHELPSKVQRAASIARKRGITVRSVSKKNFDYEMAMFQKVYNSAWQKNWGFVPLTDEELTYLGHNLAPVIVPGLTLIAEKDGDPVGFMGMLPDYNMVLKKMQGKLTPFSLLKAFYYSKKIKDLRMLLLGIKAEYRNRGVDAILFQEGYKGVRNGGYRRVEFSWILEDNIPVQRLVEMIGGRLYKKYRIYEKRI